MTKSEELSIIEDIQMLREKYVGTSWRKFEVLILLACKPQYKNKSGKPFAPWREVARKYISELRAAQEFTKIP